jgi:hypothetical protein
LLIAAACVAPRTSLAPRRDALALVQELSGLLRSDSVAASIPQAERARLASQLAPARESVVRDGMTGGTYSDWMNKLDPALDRALTQFYPSLGTGGDSRQKLVVLTYDDSARLVSHELLDLEAARKAEPPVEGIEVVEQRFISKHMGGRSPYQVLIHQERPRLNAEVLVRIKRGPVQTLSARPRPVAADSEPDVPPQLQFGRRVDSIARAEFPEAFRPSEDAYVVAVQFSEKGEVIRKDAKHFPVAQVFDTIPGGRNMGYRASGYLMDLVRGQPRTWGKSGTTFYSGTPHSVFVWGVAAEW